MATGNTSSRHGADDLSFDRGARPNSTRDSLFPFAPPATPTSPSYSRYDPWELFEIRLRTGPFNLPHRLPMHPFRPFRVMMDEDEFWRYGGAMSPALQHFVRASPLSFSNTFPDDNGGRHLTPTEVDTVLKKVKTEVYKPPSRKSEKGNKDKGKRKNGPNDHTCSICLEDFFAKQQIMRLPCKHRFHSECLTPWIKSHGQCPVCRLDLTGRAPTTNNNEHDGNGGQLPLNVNANSADEMALLIRAMEEAFASLNASPR